MADDQYLNYGFLVEFGSGERCGFFTRLSNVGKQIDTIEYREGGVQGNVRKLPGRTRVNDITLHNGCAKSTELWQWAEKGANGEVERRNIKIVALAADGVTAVMKLKLTDCWVCGIDVADFDSLGSEVLLERLTVCAENLEREDVGGAD